ncbi:hypothetical protein L1987_48132 [Smallanthus sonchifolius]|uniref:Uncharacterized protein n=1 Tax=Smallanthus sonchifolius TaxID=185202 RepID=A0ACB9FR59_9ASTR|nr:hypothetical protein L1987_48132 [Smallanthus sonchifolius]
MARSHVTMTSDLFTIGAGSGGVRASRFAANFGASLAVCELPFATISSETTGGVGGTFLSSERGHAVEMGD